MRTRIGEEELLAIDFVVCDRGLTFRTRKPIDKRLPLFGLHIGVLRRVNEDHSILVEQFVVTFDQDLKVVLVIRAVSLSGYLKKRPAG